MTDSKLPLLIEAEQLKPLLNSPDILVIDLCRPDVYAQVHIPGAVHLEYSQIIAANPPVMGLLPDADTLSQVLSGIGLSSQRHVVAYDEEGGGRAARLLWTLEAAGHPQGSLLNGGLHAWMKEGHPTEKTVTEPSPGNFSVAFNPAPVAERGFILEHLKDDQVKLLDSRSIEEYRGEKKFAARAGHIPGAVNLDWTMVMDKTRNMRLKPDAELRALVSERGLSDEQTVITYCQTHHRSALTWFVLKYLGFAKVKGYPGSWSDWGNQADTPIET